MQPVLFVSHGAPTAALERNAYSEALAAFGRANSPDAIVMVSAHWQDTGSVRVTAWRQAPLIYDFSGFPEELYEIRYPAPGNPQLAGEIRELLDTAGIPAVLDDTRGLDHGAWVPLRLAWPDARIPVAAVSLPYPTTPQQIFAIGRALAPLRSRGVLLAGSGGIVHNLRRVRLGGDPPPENWAVAFDQWVQEQLDARDFDALLDYRARAPQAQLAHPTPEHFEPLFFTTGAAVEKDRLMILHQGIRYGNLSMRSVAFLTP